MGGKEEDVSKDVDTPHEMCMKQKPLYDHIAYSPSSQLKNALQNAVT